MPDHGVDLGADLYKLAVVARDDLPSVAAVYGDAVAKYNQSRSGLEGAMTRPDHFGGGSLGPVHGAWVALHAASAKFLADTQSSLTSTATALNKAIDMYAATDATAAAEFKRLCDVNGEPHVGG